MIAPLQQRLREGRTVVGIWSVVASATLVEIGARAGLDFHILDMEHGAYDIGSLEEAIRAAECGGSAPLVRVPDLTPSTFQRVLDLGAHGIIAPQIRSARDAELVVKYSKYPPRGTRGYNPFTRVANYAAPPSDQHGKLSHEFGVLGVIIENLEACGELENICAIPEIGLIYLGIYDMSLVLGCQGNTSHPKVQQFVERSAKQVVAAGKTLGLMARSQSELVACAQLGAKLIVYGVDAHAAYQAFRAPVEYIENNQSKFQL